MGLTEPLSGRELAAFVTAAEAGSIQGAADALALTQSAATKRIQALERRIGHGLLERRAGGVVLTEHGRLLYPAAREALAALDRAEAIARRPPRHSVLRIVASRTIGETLLPQWLAAFREVAMDVRVAVEVTNSADVSSSIKDGKAQIGFVEGPDAPLRGLRALEFSADELRVIVAAAHPWARRRAVPLKFLANEQFFAREQGSGTRAVADAELEKLGMTLHPSLELSSTEALKRAVRTGGFTLMSELSVESELAAGVLVSLPLAGVQLWRTFRAVRRSRTTLPEPAERFWRWLDRYVSSVPVKPAVRIPASVPAKTQRA
ncbi:MAG: LysR family transcriptional regulator [Solirubrobacteraceae bacterium]